MPYSDHKDIQGDRCLCKYVRGIVHTINVDDNTAPIVTGSITPTTVEGCSIDVAPAQ